jgi:hypothetical protein
MIPDLLINDEPVAEFNSDACVQQGGEYTDFGQFSTDGRHQRGTLQDRCILHVAYERSAQARQRAVEVGLHRRFLHVSEMLAFVRGC